VKPVSGKAMCKVLQRLGWVCVRINGAHHQFQKPGGSVVITVPVHGNKDLRTGTQRGIMRDAGLTDADL
jgi:predicted RNA binding protein YcfA (HicA-like mRNA interferase family)